MEAVSVQSMDNEWIVRIDKTFFPPEFLTHWLERLRVEFLIQKAEFHPSLFELADKMEDNWWAAHGEEFLKDVVK